jgi:lipopolysaccharide transport system permease protein
MRNFSISPSEMAASIWRNRTLVAAMVKREVMGRYRGSVLGIVWSFFNPILMLAVYTFVFGVVFNARWAAGHDSRSEFALVLFAGLIVFNVFSECLNRAPGLILANVNYVKKVVFPLEILPVVSLGAAMFHAVVSLGVWLLAYVVLIGTPQPTVALLPLAIIPLVLLVLGFTWALAALGVYLRDVSQVIGIVTTALMFLSPVFYPLTAIPEAFRPLLHLNPLTPSIEQTRDMLFWGKLPDVSALLICWLGAFAVAWAGFAWFQKARKGFADVL